MRYAIFTDVHANLEALEAVLGKIDELAQVQPIDEIWFLGDLVGYGPDPNQCITKLRARTDVIIAGNHDWAAVGKIDLDDFSAAARIAAEWTAEQLTEEHRTFLANLPERIEIDDCTLVHGSPYSPLLEYLTSEVLAERSFQCFSSRYCFVGHTHVPIIFEQPDPIANTPTLPLADVQQNGIAHPSSDDLDDHSGEDTEEDNQETEEMVAAHPAAQTTQAGAFAESAYANKDTGLAATEEEANIQRETRLKEAERSETVEVLSSEVAEETEAASEKTADPEDETTQAAEDDIVDVKESTQSDESTARTIILNTEHHLTGSELEEILTLLGLNETMLQVTNQMIAPPEGHFAIPTGYRAIINPGGVGQPRDGDPRAAFMIYDTDNGFEFYRIPYALEQTQQKIIKAGLPQYLAIRLAYGR